ncbi:hypothetical protein TNCV_1357811 [Trichonephila clavipes]|uniref:Uncharacterized protein n=1 Tax=Trichonephila clavipes TaxID=2585209 RepID=A0A8X6VJL0_TRICX|nr:hypothetical protein TNCV_1357811 [Trichonephila clavipes]
MLFYDVDEEEVKVDSRYWVNPTRSERILSLGSKFCHRMDNGYHVHRLLLHPRIPKVCVYLRVQLLMQHFDEEPNESNVSVATERTPIVM